METKIEMQAIYRKALREISHNRYVVLDSNGRVVDTKVLMDGDIVLSDAEADDV